MNSKKGGDIAVLKTVFKYKYLFKPAAILAFSVYMLFVSCAQEKPIETTESKEFSKPISGSADSPVVWFRTTKTSLPNPAPNKILYKDGKIYIINTLTSSISTFSVTSATGVLPQKIAIIAGQLDGTVTMYDPENGKFFSTDLILKLEDEKSTNIEKGRGVAPYDAEFVGDVLYILTSDFMAGVSDILIGSSENGKIELTALDRKGLEMPTSINYLEPLSAVVITNSAYSPVDLSYGDASLTLLDASSPKKPNYIGTVSLKDTACKNPVDVIYSNGIVFVTCAGNYYDILPTTLAIDAKELKNLNLNIKANISAGGISPQIVKGYIYAVDWNLGVLGFSTTDYSVKYSSSDSLKLIDDFNDEKYGTKYQSAYYLTGYGDRIWVCYLSQKKIVEGYVGDDGSVEKRKEIDVGKEPCPMTVVSLTL